MKEIQFHFENITAFSFHKKLLISNIKYLIINEKGSIGAISVVFCSDDYLLDINKHRCKIQPILPLGYLFH
jgi:hypothetical protein